MSHQQFVYDDGLLQKCATSNFAARLLVSSATVNQRGSNRDDDDVKTTFVPDDTSCRRLFAQHAVHFGRRPAILLPNNEKDYKTRMYNFVRNVVFVYKHNAQNADVDASSSPQTSIVHRVGLNQFSDLRLSEILPAVLDDEEEANEAEAAAQKRHHHPPSRGSSRWLWEKAAAALWEAQTNDNNNVKGIDVMESANFTLFSSRQQILDVAAANFMVMGNMGAGLPSSAHHPPEPFPLIAGPDDVSIKEDHGSDGSLLSINDINDQQGRTNRKKFDRQNNDDDDITPGATGFDDDNGKFATYLNWATTDNPDRVPLVNAPIDQGTCGSCWAYVAAGSVEASAARSAGLDAYQGFKSTSSSYSGRTNNNNHNNNKVDINKASPASAALHNDKALTNARRVEYDAMQMLNLSIQELIDCDTRADEGCTGGNPILAFYFIHRYGLVSWEQYPYVAAERTCKSEWTRNPLATVQSWGILTPNDEAQMELVLRYIGPIAVGLNGGSDSFLAYSGGIYSNPSCKHGANHAMLVVGYGQATDSHTGHVTKYWITRNSWGKGWGEDGYVRVARGQGKGGVCGLEKSPSVALGGVLVGNHGLDKYRNHAPAFSKRDYGMSSLQQYQYPGNAELDDLNNNPSLLTIFCENLGFSIDSPCVKAAIWFPQHKPLCFGLSAMAFCATMALWLLAMDGRAGRRRLRQRRASESSSASRRSQLQQQISQSALSQHEASPLLDATTQPSYTSPTSC